MQDIPPENVTSKGASQDRSAAIFHKAPWMGAIAVRASTMAAEITTTRPLREPVIRSLLSSTSRKPNLSGLAVQGIIVKLARSSARLYRCNSQANSSSWKLSDDETMRGRLNLACARWASTKLSPEIQCIHVLQTTLSRSRSRGGTRSRISYRSSGGR
ncbi:hypothetical protein AKJ16_DCAP01381 [Drosera capensis]